MGSTVFITRDWFFSFLCDMLPSLFSRIIPSLLQKRQIIDLHFCSIHLYLPLPILFQLLYNNHRNPGIMYTYSIPVKQPAKDHQVAQRYNNHRYGNTALGQQYSYHGYPTYRYNILMNEIRFQMVPLSHTLHICYSLFWQNEYIRLFMQTIKACKMIFC